MHIYTILKNRISFVRNIAKQSVLVAALFLISGHMFAQVLAHPTAVPPNDEPCNGTTVTAIDLTPGAACTFTTFSNVDASASAGIPLSTTGCPTVNYTDADVWFTATVPTGATSITIDSKTMGMGDGAMVVYTATGSCPNLTFTQVACNDDGSANLGFPKLTVSGAAGTVFYIRFFGQGGEQGSFALCVTATIPPPNNECATATALTVNPDYLCGVTTAGTTINATQSTNLPAPGCGNANGINDDVWYTFIATSTGHRVSLSNVTGGTNMTFQVYSGTCSNLTAVTGGCSTANTLDLTGLTPTTTYYVRVYTNAATAATTASFNICVGTAPPPPTNDDCAGAFNIAVVNPDLNCGTSYPGYTTSATQSTTTPSPTCGTGNGWNDDVWYTFTATQTIHRVSLLNVLPAGVAMNMQAYTGTCGTLATVAGGCVTNSNIMNLTGLTVGTVYYVRVFTDVTAAATSATFNICVGSFPAAPANDECGGAIPLTVNANQTCTVTTAGTTYGATQSSNTPNPTCGTTNGWNDDVWFSFVATGPLHRVTLSNIVGDVTSMTFQVYSGTCGALTAVTGGCINGNTLNLTGLTATTTYYVRVYTNVATPFNSATFNICIGTPPPAPINDEPCNAISLTPVVAGCGAGSTYTTYTNENATATTGVTAPGCANYSGGDVWFQVTVPAGGTFTIDSQTGVITDGGMAFYTGTSCSALTLLSCDDDSSPNGLMPLLTATGLTPGSTVWVRFWEFGGDNNGTFGIVVTTPPPPPANDECVNATPITASTTTSCTNPLQGSTYGATKSTTTPNPTCGTNNGWNDDVWYTFVCNNTNQQISLTNVAPTGTALDMTVYHGTCGSLTQVGCKQGYLLNLFGLIVGDTYTIRVFTDVTTVGTSACFNICVSSIPPPGPGEVCNVAQPFCSTSQPTQNSPVIDPAGSQGLGQYGCLLTTPNPTWYVLQIATPGNLVIHIHQQNAAGVGLDVDYAAWGPFTSVADGCSQIGPTTSTGAPMVSCSYSAAADETVTIPNTQVGQFYILLVTNYNAGAGTISFTPGAGNVATTNCAIVCNATATNNGPVCPGGTFNLFGTSTSNNPVYSWTGPNGFTSNQQNPTGVVAPATAGNYVYTLTVTVPGNTCTGTTTVVVAQPAAPTVTTPVTYCQGVTAVPLTATGSNLLWYTTATGGVGSSTAPTPSTATVGSTTYYVSQTFTPCEGPRAAIVVNVVAGVAAPAATSPVTYCQGATAVPLTATGTNLLWYTTATGGTGNTTAPTPSTTTVGTTPYYVTQSNGSCESPRTVINVVINATPAAPTVTSPVNYCQNANAGPLTATGTNLLWYTTPTGGTGTSTAPIPSTATPGTTIYYVSSTTGICEGPRAAITVNIGAPPAAPTVTSPVTYCQNATAVPLIATASPGGTLLWYTVPTGGTSSSTTPTPSTATVGTTTYYVSQIVSGCEGPRASIVVNINAAAAAPTVTSPVIYCQGATAVPLNAAGSNILWYTAATGGTGSSTAPTPSTATAGTTTYYVTQSNGCESPRAAINVIVNPTPVAPTVTSPVNYCQNATAGPLTATGTNLLWYTTATGGTGSSTAPTPSTITVGTTIYYVSSTTGTCEGPRAAITVNVNALPAAPTVTSPVTYCQGSTAVPLTATGTGLLWYTVPTGGTGSATAPTPSTATLGNTTYYVSQTTGGCEGPRASIVVTINSGPAAPTVTTPVTYCQGATAIALTATGTNLLWYTTATGGTGSSTAPTPSTTTVGTTTYYVTQSNGCESPRAAINVVVNATPAAPTVTSPVNYCQGATAGPLTATGSGLLWYTTATGGTGTATAPTPSTVAGGTTIYYVSSTTGTCEGPRAAISVVVTALPTAPTVTSPVTYCRNAIAGPLTATGTNLLWYTAAAGGTGVSTAPTPSTANAGSTTYYVSQSTGTCEGPRAAITVNVSAPPAAPAVVASFTYCQNTTAPALTATGTNLLWYTTATGGTGSPNAPVPSTATVGSTTYYVSQTGGGCESPRAAITVTITPALTANAGTNVTIASGQTTQLNGTGTAGANYLWTANGPLALVAPSTATILNPVVMPLQTTNYFLTVSDPSGLCPSAGPSSVVVTVVTSCINVRNAFTPNGDGINDLWFVYDQSFCLSHDGVTVNVYNRYGSKVFESKNYGNSWNGTYKGKPVPDGTYYAVIDFTMSDGTHKTVRTDITILR